MNGYKLRLSVNVSWTAMRTNVVPMIVLSCLMLAIVTCYYRVPAFEKLLDPLANCQKEWGWMAAFVNRSIFCVLLPALFILPWTELRPKRPYAVLLGQMGWGGFCGVVSDWMFTFNAYLFGTGVDSFTLCVKAAVCQFLWTPFFFIPLGTVVYFWLGHGLSIDASRKDWPRHFFKDQIVPNLLANWIIWMPATVLIHILPTELQIQLSGIVGVFHALVMLKIGRGGRYTKLNHNHSYQWSEEFVLTYPVNPVSVENLTVAAGAEWTIDAAQTDLTVGTLILGGSGTLRIKNFGKVRSGKPLAVKYAAISGADNLKSWDVYVDGALCDRRILAENGQLVFDRKGLAVVVR